LTQKPPINRASKKIEKPPKKAALKKQKLEDKKTARKVKTAAKETKAIQKVKL